MDFNRKTTGWAALLVTLAISGQALADTAQTTCNQFGNQVNCTTTTSPSPQPVVIRPPDVSTTILQIEQAKALRAQREALERQQALQRQQLQLEQRRLEQAPLTEGEQRDVARFRRYLDQLDGCSRQNTVSECIDALKAADTEFAQIYAEQHAPGTTAYVGKAWKQAFSDMAAGRPSGSVVSGFATHDLYTELIKLDELRKRGLLTEPEFQQQKRRLLEAVNSAQ